MRVLLGLVGVFYAQAFWPGPLSEGVAVGFGALADSARWAGLLGGFVWREGPWEASALGFLGPGDLPPPPARRWHGVCADFRWVWVAYGQGGLRVALGRVPHRWGMGLALGGEGPPFPSVSWTWERGDFGMSWLMGALDPYVVSRDTSSGLREVVARYVAAHRATWEPAPWARFYFGELVYFGREEGVPEAEYFIPITVWYFWSYTHGDRYFLNDDYLWDIGWFLGNEGAYFRGEWLIDDFQYTPEPGWDPNQFALAVELGKGWRGWRAWLRYRMATRWCYNSRLPWTRSLYWNWVVGAAEGSDFQELGLGLASPRFRLALGMLWDGAGSVFEDFPKDDTSFPAESFMTPPVRSYPWLLVGLWAGENRGFDLVYDGRWGFGGRAVWLFKVPLP